MNTATAIKAEPIPLERTETNIAMITEQLIEEGFKRNTLSEKELFNSILRGRLDGYTTENCPHPGFLSDHAFMVYCRQCGYEEDI